MKHPQAHRGPKWAYAQGKHHRNDCVQSQEKVRPRESSANLSIQSSRVRVGVRIKVGVKVIVCVGASVSGSVGASLIKSSSAY